jgi:hypothetical protein
MSCESLAALPGVKNRAKGVPSRFRPAASPTFSKRE